MGMVIATAAIAVDRDLGRNARTIQAAMRHAKAGGAQLVHFCEGAASGYAKNEISSWDGYPWEDLRETLTEIGAQAGRLSLWTVVGAAHRLTPPNPPHNCLYVFAPDGSLAGRYDKRLCSHSEMSGWYSPGQRPLSLLRRRPHLRLRALHRAAVCRGLLRLCGRRRRLRPGLELQRQSLLRHSGPGPCRALRPLDQPGGTQQRRLRRGPDRPGRQPLGAERGGSRHYRPLPGRSSLGHSAEEGAPLAGEGA